MNKSTMVAAFVVFALGAVVGRISVESSQAQTRAAIETISPSEMMQGARDLPTETFDTI